MATAFTKLVGGLQTECVKCQQTIKDVVVEAMGKTWHQEHFTCNHCQKPITSPRYHVYNEMPYCEVCYESHYLKTCSRCGEIVRDVVVVALNKPWHREHFTCARCDTVLTHKGFYERDGQPYCQDCYEKHCCPTCKRCVRPISDVAVILKGDKYHTNCFQCSRCQQPVMDCTFKIVENQVVCSNCASV